MNENTTNPRVFCDPSVTREELEKLDRASQAAGDSDDEDPDMTDDPSDAPSLNQTN